MSGVLNKAGSDSGVIGITEGVSGGGAATAVWTAEAEGSITAGDKMILLADGKISSVAVGADSALDTPTADDQQQTLGVRVPSPNFPVTAQGTSSGQNLPDTPSQKPWICWDPFDDNKFIVAYDNINSPGRTDAISVRIGTMSGTTISFGTAVTVDGQYWASDHSPAPVHFHPTTQNLFAVCYAGSGQGDVRLYFGTVSGTAITMGSYYESPQSGTWYGRRGGVCAFSWDYVSSTNHWVWMYDGAFTAYGGPNTGKYARHHPKIVCGTVSDTATGISTGTPIDVHSYMEMNDTLWYRGFSQVRSCRFDPNTANKFLVSAFKNKNSTQTVPTLFICTTNGSTTVTMGSEIDLDNAVGITGKGESWCEWNPAIANQIVFSGQQTYSGETWTTDPVAVVGTVSGSSVSWGSIFRLMPDSPNVTSQPWQIFFGAGKSAGRFYGATTKMPAGGLVGYIYIQAFDITGTTITAAVAGVNQWRQAAPHQWFDLHYGNTHIGVAFPWHIAVSGNGMKYMISCLRATGSGNHTKFCGGGLGTAGATNITATNFIGIADNTYGDGVQATVQLQHPSIDDSQSGLTIGSTYYVQPNGSLSTTPGNPSVVAGVALSATQLLIKD